MDIGAFESRPVRDGAEPGLAKSGAAGLAALRPRWPLFDLRARKVSGQRSGLEAHGARPVRAARGGLHGGGEAGCERSGAAAAARWPLRWSVLAKAAPSEAARSWRGKRRGAADRAAVRVDGLRVYGCLAAGAFEYTVSTCTTKLHAGSMSIASTSIACVLSCTHRSRCSTAPQHMRFGTRIS